MRERIGRLYAVEAQARAENLGAKARQQRRQEQSAAEVAALKARRVAIRAEVLPGSQLAKACDYALRIWGRLEVFLEHGQVEIDTIICWPCFPCWAAPTRGTSNT